MKGLLIDSTKREIREVLFDGLRDIQTLIGGYIEVAYGWENGDTLFVDEEGLLKRGVTELVAFRIPQRPDQALAGNGLLVGREVEGDEYPTGYTNVDPIMTADELRKLVTFGVTRPLP